MSSDSQMLNVLLAAIPESPFGISVYLDIPLTFVLFGVLSHSIEGVQCSSKQ